MDLQKTIQQTLQDLTGQAETLIHSLIPDNEPVGGKPEPAHKKVMVVIYNPTVPSEGKRKLREVLNWSNPDSLIPRYIADIQECSYGYVNYSVVERVEVDKFPVKEDGFAYTGDEFVKCLRSNAGFHQPDAVNYQAILSDFDIVRKVNSGAVDEVWLFAFPYAGFYESIMGGPGAFWCNAPELVKGTEQATRRFVIMGYNYQRGVGEMLENFGHRAESILKHTFRFTRGDANLWERFSRYDKTHPGQAEVGIVHYAPNSDRDYDWGNPKKVPSRHAAWLNFPNLQGEPRIVDCTEWGKGDIREHHLWWFRHFPHITGSASGLSYNWWKYCLDPNTVR